MQAQRAVTFHVLQKFHLLSFMSKVLMDEFYHTLECLTDNTGTQVPLFCCIWMNKHFGFGHVLGGVEAATPGKLAVMCPACPCPGVNLPSGWESTPPKKV
ncbi:hypothetical protein GYMLUDRAFT_175889 [Collybiopsis luxurians FD-317 M1]|uniref:Unplaced genomic scaffold GYMLUscaffold_60, whole genome shotgun sequence n=1 Tax=Collybiopsis luxurians FD-317 M1 TaxID=944289 RepID=A0A0D0BKH1_9AGAR|nr:hypothetical protein GYMLUDRAFT_175889 [Collybiopsis luxurians FD-317 M1]